MGARTTVCSRLNFAVSSSADIARSRRQTETEREAGLNSLRAGLQCGINRLTQEIDALARTEAQEIARELDRLQQQHIQTYLAQQSTRHAFLGGMTAETGSASLSRYPTAANIELHAPCQIKGIGPRRAAALIGWRRIHEIRARQTLPQSLPPVIEDAIKFPIHKGDFIFSKISRSGSLTCKQRQTESARRLLPNSSNWTRISRSHKQMRSVEFQR